jgi:predicted ATPase/DNA-binding XRE family transcriptional regulator
MADQDRRTTFGTLLHSYREVAGLTQEALAERAGLSARAISDLERGINRAPRAATLGLLARALQLSAPERARLEVAVHQLDGFGATSLPVDEQAKHGRPPFVGREAELALLDRQMAGEGPPVLLLAGEPGIGKSRLLEEAASRAAQVGWQVLAGGCQRRGDQEPYAPVQEALERYLQDRSPGALRADLEGCAWLVRLLPELAALPIEPLPTWHVSPQQERRLLFRAVARLLANAAGPAGTLLVLDDLQWAGSDALELLGALVRMPDLPLRVVGAYRDTEVGMHDHLTSSLADLANAGLARHHTLTPLADEEAARLLAALLEGVDSDLSALTAELVRRAGGVPFFLLSCAQEVRSGGLAPGAEEVPWDVAQGIRQRVEALPTLAQEVLSAAALIGRLVPSWLLTAVVGQQEAAVWAALDAGCHAHLLSEGQGGYQFTHDLIREVVEHDVGPGRRMALHQRIAEAFEQQAAEHGGEAPVTVLAYHYSRSGKQEKALLYLERAGERAQAQGAYAAAEGYYRDLVGRLDGLGWQLEAARAREKLGAVLYMAAQYTAALEVLERAAETLEAARDLESLGRVVSQLGRAHAWKGTLEEGVARILPLLDALSERKPTRGQAACYYALELLYYMQGRYQQALAAAVQAAEVLRQVGDDGLLADVERTRGAALDFLDRQNEARQAYQEACRLAEATGNLDALCNALHMLALQHELRGEFDQVRACAASALDVAQRLGNLVLVAQSLQRLGALAFFDGDWAQAEAYFTRMQILPERTYNDGDQLLEVGRLRLAQGEWEQAADYLERCRALAWGIGQHANDLVAESLLAERDILAARPAEAVARVLPLLDYAGREGMLVTTYVLPVLAWAYLELGDTEQAAQVIAEACRQAGARSYRLGLVQSALRVQALVAMQQEEWDKAQAALEEGLTLARCMPYPYAEARLLQVYGQLHLRRSEPGLARERLQVALAIFRRLGARKASERVEQDLGQLA